MNTIAELQAEYERLNAIYDQGHRDLKKIKQHMARILAEIMTRQK